MNPFIPAAHWHFLTSSYEVLARPFAGRIWKKIANEVAARAPQNATVMDLGCGPGTVLRLIRKQRPDLTLFGADIDPAIIDIAKKRSTDRRIIFRIASIDNLPFQDSTADIIISSLMFHHLDEPTKRTALNEIRRILVPSGTFLLCDFSVPTYSWIAPIAAIILAWEHEAPKQLRGQLFDLVRNTDMKMNTLTMFYGLIALHVIQPR